jgi:hypothetical protein
METATAKKASTDVLIGLYDFHTKLFNNVLVDISDKDANNRLGTKANHIAWIAGSLVHGRHALANIVGIHKKQTSDKLFENNKGIQDNLTYPPLAEYKKDWQNISTVLKDALVNLSEDQLNGPDPFDMPGEDFTLFDALTFCIDRESYCIGQIGLYRRLLGYEAMKYD